MTHPAENDARLTEAEREGLIEAVQAGTEVEYVEALIAGRLTRAIPRDRATEVPVLDVHADDPAAEADRYAADVEAWAVPDRLDAEWHRNRGV